MATSPELLEADFGTMELRVMAYLEPDIMVELSKQGEIVMDLYRKAMACDRGSDKFMNLYSSYWRAEEHLRAMQKAALNTGGIR